MDQDKQKTSDFSDSFNLDNALNFFDSDSDNKDDNKDTEKSDSNANISLGGGFDWDSLDNDTDSESESDIWNEISSSFSAIGKMAYKDPDEVDEADKSDDKVDDKSDDKSEADDNDEKTTENASETERLIALLSQTDDGDEDDEDIVESESISDDKAESTGDDKAESTSDDKAESTGDDKAESTGDDKAESTGNTDNETDRLIALLSQNADILDIDEKNDADDGEVADADDGEAADADDDDEDKTIRLSERMRMGNVIPEGEIITCEHTLGHDVVYSEEVLQAEVVQEKEKEKQDHAQRKTIVKILLGILLILFCALILVVINTFKLESSSDIQYAQKGVFQTAHSEFTHIANAAESNTYAMCSATYGVVMRDQQIVSEFWPTIHGCKDLKVSNDGKRVWYVDNMHQLHEIDLETDFGFNPKTIAVLNDYAGFGFDVQSNTISYFALVNRVSPVLRTIDLATKIHKDIELPEDALPCSGMTSQHYAYVSKDAVHIVSNNITYSSTLASEKQACLRASVKACATDGYGSWSVLCDHNIHQGQNKSAAPPVAFDDVGIRSAAKTFQLLRHKKGTELLTTDKWIHIDASSKSVETPIKQPLNNFFKAIWTGDEINPIQGINNGQPITIAADGTIQAQKTAEALKIMASAFVSHGNHVAVFHHDANTTDPKSNITVWSLANSKPVSSITFNGLIRKVNISQQGNYGFIAFDNMVTWMDWNANKPLGNTQPLQKQIIDASWDDTESHALIQYDDKSYDLMQRTETGMKLLRSYPAETVVAFAHDGLMWRYEKGSIMNERVGDGAVSVVLANIENAQISGITTHQYADTLLLWGQDGLWTYQHTTKQIQKLLDTPTTWVNFDRQGQRCVTNHSIINLTNAEVTKLPDDLLNTSLVWSGSSQYLTANDGSVIVDLANKRSMPTSQANRTIQFIGNNAGAHPYADFILQNRHNNVTIETLTADGSKAHAAFEGKTQQAWCWIDAQGNIQGVNHTCTSFQKDENGMPMLNAGNQNVTFTAQNTFKWTAPQNLKTSPMTFSDNVNLSIRVIPDTAFISFISADNNLPDGLKFENGIAPVPFQTTIKSNEQWFSILAIAEGYEDRIVVFQPNQANMTYRIAMLKVGARDFTLAWYQKDAENNNHPITVAEDLDIEFKTMLQSQRDALTACVKTLETKSISIISDANNALIPVTTQNETVDKCLTPIVYEMQVQHLAGALPDLKPNTTISVVVP